MKEIFQELQENLGEWTNVGPAQVVALGIFVVFLFFQWFAWGWIMILDDANLIFHEAGHKLIWALGDRLEIYGGTVGQLAFPLVTTIIFWFRREAVSCACCGVWFFQNFPNIARYMADARAMELPLIGGDIHDWNEILTRWHLLWLDTTLAFFVRLGGYLGILAVLGWLMYRSTKPGRIVPWEGIPGF